MMPIITTLLPKLLAHRQSSNNEIVNEILLPLIITDSKQIYYVLIEIGKFAKLVKNTLVYMKTCSKCIYNLIIMKSDF